MNPDPLKPKTWVKFDPANCKGCWAGCCTLPVPVSTEELFHMGFMRYDQVNGPMKRIAGRLKREGVIQSYNDRTRVFVLAQKNGTDCVFLDGNRMCKIYENRPVVCRDFPENSLRPGYCPARPNNL